MFAASRPARFTALAVALCAAAHDGARGALCFAIGDTDATIDTPQWRKLIPAPDADGTIRGRDGRAWRMSDPQAVVQAFDLVIPIDVNHASELRAPEGNDAPAQGWVDALEVREGAIWGRIDWTPLGRQAVADKLYRFLSPVIRFDPDTREIYRLISVGLVNDPNFPLALNHRADQQETPAVDEEIRKALGLPEKATATDAVTAINSMRSSATPALDKFVPRADYDTALNRATTAETSLRERDQATLQASIDAAIDGALKAGKITPATVDYHKASCAAKGGLERFQAFVAAAPAVGDPSGLEGKTTPGAETKALNAATKTIAAMFGNSAEDIAKYAPPETA